MPGRFCYDPQTHTHTLSTPKAEQHGGILSTDVTLAKTRFIFVNWLLSKQVTVRVDQVEGKRWRVTVCALCYIRIALQSSQEIPRLVWYPLSRRNSSA